MTKKTDEAPTVSRRIKTSATKPAHLSSRGGTGRSREATEFDDMVPEWFQSGEWVKIESEGDDDAAKLQCLENDFKAVNKAVQYHDLGADRLKEDNPEDPNFESYGVWVHVRERQARGPEKGSIKDPVTGERVGPTKNPERHAELLAMREAEKADA